MPAIRVDYLDAAVEFIRLATTTQEDELKRAFVDSCASRRWPALVQLTVAPAL